MRLLFVADGRSPIALDWISYFVRRGDEVHLVSTFPSLAPPGLASFDIIPVAFSRIKDKPAQSTALEQAVSKPSQIRTLSRLVPVRLRTGLRQWLGPLTIPGAAQRLAVLAQRIQPDLVHAMRIPYEGMLAAQANLQIPLVISVWGNDFTLHARSNPWMAANTRLALQRASALHADCRRDLRLAREWGYSPDRPSFVVPGNGGVQLDIFYPPPERIETPTIINPRGFRVYLRSDTFFRAVPLVLAKLPTAHFLCTGMSGEPQALRWLEEFGITENVELLPLQSRLQMGELFRRSQVAVSPSTHDGTPNTLLEAMACGCFPVAGDIESLREWITPGENGFLIDPADEHTLAEAILQAFARSDLRQHAAQINRDLVASRAEYSRGMQQVEKIYSMLINSVNSGK
jgi:glycosyltransferase involved in cell wall biosynthesis